MKIRMALIFGVLCLTSLTLILLTLSFPESIAAAPSEAIFVDTYLDDATINGNCSLREAIIAANTDSSVDECQAGFGEDVVVLPSGTYSLTIQNGDGDTPQVGDLDITSPISLRGMSPHTTIINGKNIPDRILEIHTQGNLELLRLQVSNGTPNVQEAGGGIANFGKAKLIDCILKENTSGWGGGTRGSGSDGGPGGGIYNKGILSIQSCRIENNQTGEGGSTYYGGEAGNSGPGGGIYNAGTMTITLSTVSFNKTPDGKFDWGAGSAGDGGGIFNAGHLFINASTIASNHTGNGGDGYAGGNGGHGGGIYNSGELILRNTTISGNTAGEGGSGSVGSKNGGNGGGLFNSGTSKLKNVTISGNSSGNGDNEWNIGRGGGVFNQDTAIFFGLNNSLLAGNHSFGEGPDCAGDPLTSQGFNLVQDSRNCELVGNTNGLLVETNPMLAPLRDYGGPTLTHALLESSPAIDAANPHTPGTGSNSCEATDQRGVERPHDGDKDGEAICDIGAFEGTFAFPPWAFLPHISK